METPLGGELLYRQTASCWIYTRIFESTDFCHIRRGRIREM